MIQPLIILALLAASASAAERPLSYPIVGTGQTKCYNNRTEMAPPKPNRPFYGQDAQHQGTLPSYKLSDDGLTVLDTVTGLTWQRSPDTDGDGVLTRRDKLTFAQAQQLPAKLNEAKFGGFGDWRLPTIKELYSLIVFSGVDPSGPGAEATRLTSFIDTRYFKFAYGDTSQGERPIDSQYASSTKYVGKSFRGSAKLFGVNFADGRIKGYDLLMPGGGMEKTFFVQCVRGNPSYGTNDFHDNGDGTITDRATGLMWSKTDSGKGLNWEAALAWVQAKNAKKYLGHDDWRLPHAKQLQSIVDYTRSPDTTGSPAIDPLFTCTKITNENGQADYPFYWTGTTHTSLLGVRAMPFTLPSAALRAGRRGCPAAVGPDEADHRRADRRPMDPAVHPRTAPVSAARLVSTGHLPAASPIITPTSTVPGAAQRPEDGRPRPVPTRPRPARRRHPHL